MLQGKQGSCGLQPGQRSKLYHLQGTVACSSCVTLFLNTFRKHTCGGNDKNYTCESTTLCINSRLKCPAVPRDPWIVHKNRSWRALNKTAFRKSWNHRSRSLWTGYYIYHTLYGSMELNKENAPSKECEGHVLPSTYTFLRDTMPCIDAEVPLDDCPY